MSSRIFFLWYALIHILVAREYGKRLTGHVIKAFNYAGPKQCAEECYRRTNCRSYNYNREKFYCEINGKKKEETIKDFMTDYGYFYDVKTDGCGPKEDVCTSVRCCPNHKCVPLHNGKTRCIQTARGWDSFNDSCYYYSNYTADWHEASSICMSMVAHLAIVTSAEEDAYLVSLARGRVVPVSDGAFWLDGSYLNGDWIWKSTGEIISYSNWLGPSGGQDRCLELYRIYEFKWNDHYCYGSNDQFICEKELSMC